MNIQKWKTARSRRPHWSVVLEEGLVNLLWYRTGARQLFRRALLNIEAEGSDSGSLRRNIFHYGVDRFNFFAPYVEALGDGDFSILEVGPGGLLVQALFYLAAGFRYAAIDAVDGRVFTPQALAHYAYLREHWTDISTALCSKRVLRASMPSIEEVSYRVSSLECAEPTALGCFDSILSYGVFEHLENPKLAIQKCAELITETGIMVHRIDFFPHDFWSAYDSPLEFLTVPRLSYELMYRGRGAPNRRRFSWFKHEFESAGFTVEVKDQERYGRHVLSIAPRIDRSIAIAGEEDLLISSATFVCQR